MINQNLCLTFWKYFLNFVSSLPKCKKPEERKIEEILDKQRRKRWEVFVVLKEMKEAVKKHQEFLFHFNLRFCFGECFSKDFTAECLLKCVLKVPLLNSFCAEQLLVLTGMVQKMCTKDNILACGIFTSGRTYHSNKGERG